MVSAVESLSDRVLTVLEKHHTRADVEEALKIVHAAGIALRPTWVAFTPWTTLDDYLEVLEFIEEQWADRPRGPGAVHHPAAGPAGLLPGGAPRHAAVPGAAGPGGVQLSLGPSRPAMDRLQKAVSKLVEADTKAARTRPTPSTGCGTWRPGGSPKACLHQLPRDRVRAPRLSEPWFC